MTLKKPPIDKIVYYCVYKLVVLSKVALSMSWIRNLPLEPNVADPYTTPSELTTPEPLNVDLFRCLQLVYSVVYLSLSLYVTHSLNRFIPDSIVCDLLLTLFY